MNKNCKFFKKSFGTSIKVHNYYETQNFIKFYKYVLCNIFTQPIETKNL